MERERKKEKQRTGGTQPYLTGLLSIYQVYYPNLVTLPLRSTNIIFFKSYDRNWSSILRKVKESNAEMLLNQSTERESSRKKKADLSARAPASKRRRRELIPQISASHSAVGDRTSATEKVSLSLDVARVPMIQISSFMEMVEKIDRIEFPSEICVALHDPLLQHIIVHSGDRVIASRFSYWIQHTLVEELLNRSGINKEAEKLLQHLICFMDFLQEGIPVVDTFLQIYLDTWNGADYRPYIMRLIGKLRMKPFTVLKELILEPLRKLFFTSSVYFKCQVILTLTDLTQNYVAVELFRYKDSLMQQEMNSVTSDTLEFTSPECLSLFHEAVEKFNPMHTLQELVKWVMSIANVGLIAENDHTLLTYHVIGYIELLCTLNQKYDVPFLFLPSDLLLSRIILANSAFGCSKLCSILCKYKTSFQALRSLSDQSVPCTDCIGLGQVPQFNSIVVDVCNCFSRSKLYDTKLGLGVSSVRQLVTDVPDVDLAHSNGAFSIYRHQAFTGFARSFWKQSHPQGVKFDPRQISQSQSQKEAYLEYLKNEGLTGVVQFLTMFLRKHSTAN
ncbi:centromere protein I-like [Gigantopelta aegis]|uniref:centromere protein I-like n=1 Tax=Gigantopelta aegis TaxID=1735272 RepID=UPI001B88944E|nr:centromere protein I-like [Gigantopelta aegis]